MTKSKQIFVAQHYSSEHLVWTSPSTLPVTSYTFWNVALQWNRADGTSVPMHRSKIRQGQSASSFLSGDRQLYGYTAGRLVADWPSSFGVNRRNFFDDEGVFLLPSTWSHSAGDSSEAENQARRRILQALKAQQEHWSGLVAAGELNETLRSIRKVSDLFGTKVLGYLRKQKKNAANVLGFELGWLPSNYPDTETVRRLREKPPTAKQWAKLRKKLADTWLAFAFEVRPLVKDIQEGAETVARWNAESYGSSLLHSSIRGFGEQETVLFQSNAGETFDGFTANVYRLRKKKIEVIFRAGYRGEGIRPYAAHDYVRLAELSGFNWRSFVPSIWQLLPWSFFVDYFVNVGDLLNAAFAATDSVTWVHKTVRWTNIEVGTSGRVRSFQDPTASFGGSFGSYVKTTQSFSRSGISSIGFPSVQFRIPGQDSTAWFNILALMTGGKTSNKSGG